MTLNPSLFNRGALTQFPRPFPARSSGAAGLSELAPALVQQPTPSDIMNALDAINKNIKALSQQVQEIKQSQSDFQDYAHQALSFMWTGVHGIGYEVDKIYSHMRWGTSLGPT